MTEILPVSLWQKPSGDMSTFAPSLLGRKEHCVSLLGFSFRHVIGYFVPETQSFHGNFISFRNVLLFFYPNVGWWELFVSKSKTKQSWERLWCHWSMIKQLKWSRRNVSVSFTLNIVCAPNKPTNRILPAAVEAGSIRWRSFFFLVWICDERQLNVVCVSGPDGCWHAAFCGPASGGRDQDSTDQTQGFKGLCRKHESEGTHPSRFHAMNWH